jgi:hypothetical protein
MQKMTEEKRHPFSGRSRAGRGRKVNPEILLDRARRLRRKTKDHPIADNELRTAKQMGRP